MRHKTTLTEGVIAKRKSEFYKRLRKAGVSSKLASPMTKKRYPDKTNRRKKRNAPKMIRRFIKPRRKYSCLKCGKKFLPLQSGSVTRCKRCKSIQLSKGNPAKGKDVLLKIYRKYEGMDEKDGRISALYATKHVSSGRFGIKSKDKFVHEYKMKPRCIRAKGKTRVQKGDVIIKSRAVFGAQKSGVVKLPAGSKILRGKKPAWHMYHEKKFYA